MTDIEFMALIRGTTFIMVTFFVFMTFMRASIDYKLITKFYVFLGVYNLVAVGYFQGGYELFIGLSIFVAFPFIVWAIYNLISYIVWFNVSSKLKIKGTTPDFVGHSLNSFIKSHSLFNNKT
tara:strand:+ start:153 stop:518 length:366 start_codon:yes stop_codon:yes gene_type:complete